MAPSFAATDSAGTGGRVAAGPDFVPEALGETSRITLVKRGAHIQFAVNGHLCLDWGDDGVSRGPVLGGGKIGLRQMQGAVIRYGQFRVWRIADE